MLLCDLCVCVVLCALCFDPLSILRRELSHIPIERAHSVAKGTIREEGDTRDTECERERERESDSPYRRLFPLFILLASVQVFHVYCWRVMAFDCCPDSDCDVREVRETEPARGAYMHVRDTDWPAFLNVRVAAHMICFERRVCI